MFYDFAIAVTAGTEATNPKTQELKLARGIIHRVEVEFRQGTDFRVGVRLNHEGSQLYPTNRDGDFKADGRAIVFDDHFPIDRAPYKLKFIGYSPTASYDHTIYVRIGVLEAELFQPLSGLTGMLKKLLAMFGVG